MPLYDFHCPTCTYHFEAFFKMAEVPEVTACQQPGCQANAVRFYTFRRADAKPFDPIVVHRTKLEDGSYKYSYPGRSDDPVDPGYEKVEMTTFAQADRFVKDRDREEQELRRENINAEEAYWDQRAKDRHEVARQELQKRLGKDRSEIGEKVWAAMEKRRKAKYEALRNKGVNFHIAGMSFDENNRREYRDPDRNRKVSVVVQGLRQ